MLDFLNENLIFYFVAIVVVLVTFLEYISHLSHSKYKKILVSFISVGLILWLDWLSFLLLSFLATVVFCIVKLQWNIRKNILWIVVGSIGLLVFIKDSYSIFSLQKIYIPLGISYYFFRLLSFLIDYSKNPLSYKDISLINYYHYIYFFPIFLAGPIHRFSNFKELDREVVQAGKPRWYFRLILAITLKAFVVDLILRRLAYSIMQVEVLEVPSMERLIIFGFLAFWHSYLDLLLYTEIANNISGILGFTRQENFNKPLMATNISMFWQRWHISLSNWTRDYIFFPTLLTTRNTWLATYCSMFVIGIWHSCTLSWIFWAFCHATAINIYGEIRKTRFYKTCQRSESGKSLLRITGVIFTNVFVSTVFVFVAFQDFQKVVELFLSALGVY